MPSTGIANRLLERLDECIPENVPDTGKDPDLGIIHVSAQRNPRGELVVRMVPEHLRDGLHDPFPDQGKDVIRLLQVEHLQVEDHRLDIPLHVSVLDREFAVEGKFPLFGVDPGIGFQKVVQGRQMHILEFKGEVEIRDLDLYDALCATPAGAV